MAADPRELLVWRGRSLSGEAEEPARLLVADSFLLAAGGVVALDRHRARFLADLRRPEVAALARVPLDDVLEDAPAFWAAAVPALPAAGAWFPRIELAATERAAQLRLRVRPAPPLTRSVTVASWTGADPRSVPTVKGPDLESLLQVRAAVRLAGADEAVLLTADGGVADGTTSALLWWRDGRLCRPPDDVPRVASVTAAAVADLAAADGIEVLPERARPEDLAGAELWVVNALHGIRGVDRWIGGPDLSWDPERFEEWQRRLETLRRPAGPSPSELFLPWLQGPY